MTFLILCQTVALKKSQTYNYYLNMKILMSSTLCTVHNTVMVLACTGQLVVLSEAALTSNTHVPG